MKMISKHLNLIKGIYGLLFIGLVYFTLSDSLISFQKEGYAQTPNRQQSHHPAHNPQQNAQQEHVVLLHGYGRSASAMRPMKKRFEQAGYQVHVVEYSSLMSSMDEIEHEVAGQINHIVKTSPAKIHFVGHSLGGLLIRSYLGKNQVKTLGRVVTLGSPNQGTAVVEYFEQKWWFRFAGSAARSLSSEGSPFLKNLPQPTYPLGVIAGVSKYPFIKKSKLKSPHDGLVSLESTKVEGMTDFAVVKANHTALRYNQKVFNHILTFLQHGAFKH